MICTSGDVSGNIHRVLRPFICSSRHVVLVIKQANKIAFNIARGYYDLCLSKRPREAG